MHSVPVNWWPVIVATLAKMVLGGVWYSPVLFVGEWQRMVGVSDAQMKAAMPKALVVDLVGSFVMAVVLVHAVHYAGAAGIGGGLAVGFFSWLGFVGFTTLSAVIYEQRPLKLFLINNGYLLLALLIMSAILGVWQ
jgi:hypothetical protein